MQRSSTIFLFCAFILIQASFAMPGQAKDLQSLFHEINNLLSDEAISPHIGAMNEVFSAIVYVEGSHVISRDDRGALIARGIAGKDDVSVIKKTISALPEGMIVLDGTFKITNAIDNLNSNLILKGIPGRTKFDCTRVADSIFWIGGDNYEHKTTDLIEDASAGDPTISVIDAAGYNVNDYVKLIDDEEIMQFKKGQIFRIEYIKQNDIYLDKEVDDSYSVNRNAIIRKVIMFENITIDGIEFVGPGLNSTERLMHAHLLKDFNFVNNSVTSFGESALDISDSLNCTIANNSFENIFMPGMGYSIALSNACEDIWIINNSFKKKGRHYIAVGGATGDFSDGGFARDLTIMNNYFEYSTQEAVNTHPPFIGPINISGNTFFYCDKGLSIFNGHSNIYNNLFKNCLIGIQILSYDLGDNERIYRIYSNEFENTIYDLKIEIEGDVVKDDLSEGCFILKDREMLPCDN